MKAGKRPLGCFRPFLFIYQNSYRKKEKAMTINRFDAEGKLSARITQITVPSFKQLADLAVQHQAIDLGGGKPDFPADAAFKKAAIQAIQDDFNQYAPTQGVAELRQGISKRLQQKTQEHFDAEQEITICSGVTESTAAALLAIIDPGDEVIVLVPAFASYAADVQLCGGKPVYVELTQPDFRLEKEKVEAVITARTKAIIFNSPHNPSGRVFDQEEVQGIAQLSQEYDLIVITDEIYDEIYFGAVPPIPIWKLPDMRERTIITNGFSKVYSVTGWRLGYVIATPALTKGIRKAHNYLALSSALPLQMGMVEAVGSEESYYIQLRKDYSKRLDILKKGFDELKIPYLAPEGGYFLLVDFSDFGWKDDFEFTKYITEHIGVSARPLSGFYPNETLTNQKLWLRFAFCKEEEVLKEAIERFKKIKEQN